MNGLCRSNRPGVVEGSDDAEAGAHAAALAGLPGMNARRLAKLLDGFQPVMAWRAVAAGTHPADPDRRFAPSAHRTDVDVVGERYARLGVHVLLPGRRGYPSALIGDPGAPGVLFALGDPTAGEGGPAVAIVGTRSATHYGRRVASEMASALASEGVIVVSGLAAGIDAAGHAGALRAMPQAPAADTSRPDAAPSATRPGTGRPVAVVGTGLDVVYPSSSRELWAEVARRGVVFSESALGTQPHRGVFPARNRIIAALCDVIVVVESHARGGALYTAEAGARRSIPVCAVPGSVHSRASEGSNTLLVEGCIPVRDAADVMVALGLVRAGKNLARIRGGGGITSRTGAAGSHGASRPAPPEVDDDPLNAGRPGGLTPAQQALLSAVDDTPTAFETILLRSDLGIVAAAEACDQLVERGLLRSGAGWWSTA